MQTWRLRSMLGVMLLCIFSAEAQNNGTPQQKGLSLRGRIQSMTIEQDKSEDYVILRLKYELTNTRSTPIIRWKHQDPTFTGLSLARSQRFEREDIIHSYQGGPSIDTSQVWTDMQKALDKEYPPSDQTDFIKPSASLSFYSKVTIVCPKKAVPGLLYEPSLRELEAIGKIWLRVYYEAWSLNLEPDALRRKDRDFGHALQRRWEQFGQLWLDDIYSDPIMLDLNRATSKRPVR